MSVTITASANSTPPAGTIIATCAIDGEQYQLVIPAGPDGNSLGAGAASPLYASACITNLSGSSIGGPLFVAEVRAAGSAAGSPMFTSVTNTVSASLGAVRGAPNFDATQVTCASTPTLLSASRATRRGLTVVHHGGNPVWLGASTVASNTGLRLVGIDGAAFSLPATCALWGITPANTSQVVGVMETWD